MTSLHGCSRSEMLGALREFADLIDPSCTPVGYDSWARENDRPSVYQIRRRLGWRQAKTAAGVDLPLDGPEITYLGKFDAWLRVTDEGLHWAINELLPRIGRSL